MGWAPPRKDRKDTEIVCSSSENEPDDEKSVHDSGSFGGGDDLQSSAEPSADEVEVDFREPGLKHFMKAPVASRKSTCFICERNGDPPHIDPGTWRLHYRRN